MSAGRHKLSGGRAGFSLVELMISLALVMLLTLALLTSYVFIARGDRSLQNYGDMNIQARKLLERLGGDLRGAIDITNFTSTTMTLTTPSNAAATTTQDVIWDFNSVTGVVTRQDNAGTVTLARDVNTFAFYFYNGNNVETTSLVEVKQVQLSLRLLRLVASTVTSEYVISAQYTMRASQRRTDRGSAVITVLVLAAVTAVIASGFLFRSAQEAKMANRSLYDSAALNLAEAGIEEGLYAINSAIVNSANGWSLATGSTTDYVKTITTGFNYQQATGAVYVRADGAAGATPTITSTGVVTIPGQPRVIKQLRVGTTGPAKIWSNTIVAKGALTFGGSADVDAYDSSVGPYNATTNRNDRATIATNSTVQISGSATIYGSVATGGAEPSVGGSGRIYSATSPGTPLVDTSRVRTDFNANLADATAPTTTAISLGAYSVGGSGSVSLPRLVPPDLPGANGRYLYTCTSLDIAGSGHIAITGPVDIIVTGNTTVGGSGYIAVGGTGTVNPSLNIYCPGTIDFGGAGMVNNTSLPVNATIWGTKPAGSTQTISVGGSAAFIGTIYAPNANIALGGGAGVYGAVIGNTVTLSGSGDLHYDVQLANATTSAGPTPGGGSGSGYLRVGAWAELTGSPTGGGAFARDNRQPFATLF